jgi:hypothetical protein
LEIHLQEDHPCSSHKEASIMIMISQGRIFRRTTPQTISFTPMYANFFYGHCFYCTNFGHKVADCRDYKNVQARNPYVAPRNIECYKCHNYGHIDSDCRSMIDTSMNKNTDIRYKKVWIRKHEEQVPEITIMTIK